jgi:hypothetical protein
MSLHPEVDQGDLQESHESEEENRKWQIIPATWGDIWHLKFWEESWMVFWNNIKLNSDLTPFTRTNSKLTRYQNGQYNKLYMCWMKT